ncbi:MAG: hypothetical protein L0271_10330 [Gemmatimonadetes bacterium]|nr:hypothetical protein [Gemmatimonadota bacterium]
MPAYRITIRWGRPQRYHIEDVEAPELREALRIAMERFPDGARQTADLAEIRLSAGMKEAEAGA